MWQMSILKKLVAERVNIQAGAWRLELGWISK